MYDNQAVTQPDGVTPEPTTEEAYPDELPDTPRSSLARYASGSEQGRENPKLVEGDVYVKNPLSNIFCDGYTSAIVYPFMSSRA